MAQTPAEVIVTRVAEGRVEALYTGQDAPRLELRHGETILSSAAPQAGAAGSGAWVALDIPASVISDGVTVLTLHRSGETAELASVLLIAGAPYLEDLHGQVAQLRAELDQIKALLRRRLG